MQQPNVQQQAPVPQQDMQPKAPLKASNPQRIREDYKQYVDQATKLIHSPETRGAVLPRLKGSDPVGSVASTTVMIMQRLDVALRKNGVELLDSIKIFGANAIVDMLTEFGEAAGYFKMDKDLKFLATGTAMQDYIKTEVAAGRIDKQKLNIQLQKDLRQMPPEKRKKIFESMHRLQEIGRKYSAGLKRGGK